MIECKANVFEGVPIEAFADLCCTTAAELVKLDLPRVIGWYAFWTARTEGQVSKRELIETLAKAMVEEILACWHADDPRPSGELILKRIWFTK